MKQELLKITQIKVDEESYPRMKCDWFTAYDYSQSMKSGAKFPPIEVALFNKKYILIDGRHRLEAKKKLKEEYITAIVHVGLSKKQIFVKAVESNIGHGRPLSTQDKVMCIDTLEKLNFTNEQISKMVSIPMDKLERFKGTKITNTVNGKTIYLKSTTKNFAGEIVEENFNDQQTNFSTHGQIHLLKQVVSLLHNGMVDFDNPTITELIQQLSSLLTAIKIPIKITK